MIEDRQERYSQYALLVFYASSLYKWYNYFRIERRRSWDPKVWYPRVCIPNCQLWYPTDNINKNNMSHLLLKIITCTKYRGIHSCSRIFLSFARDLCASSSWVLASLAAIWSSRFMAWVTKIHNFSLSHSPWWSIGTVYFFNLLLFTSGVGLKNKDSCYEWRMITWY